MKNKIFLSCFVALTMIVGQVGAQLHVSGTVLDDKTGESVIGASVLQVGSTNGTITDFDGNFELDVPEGASLEFSYMGYKTQVLKASASMNVKLGEDNEVLDEVVVTGYTVQRKADLTGSVSVMDMDQPMSEGSPNMLSSMQGRLAGVQVSTDGAPGGEGSSIRIRGMSSINGNDPLYVIDGVPTTENLSSINSADIASIQVLKDASSASIYGSRAANGVVIITTKSGKKDRLSVNIGYAATAQTVAKTYKMLNATQWGEMFWLANNNAGISPSHPFYGNGATPQLVTNLDADGLIKAADTDWQDAVYHTAWTHNVNANTSYSSDKASVYFSANYINQDGLIKQSHYDRISARLNSTFNIGKWVKVGENLMVARWKQNGVESNSDRGIPYTAMRQHPAIPVTYTDANGNEQFASPLQLAGSDIANPAHQLYNARDNENQSWRILGNAFIEVNPYLKGLTLKSNIGIEHIQYTGFNYTRRIEPSDVPAVSRTFGQGDTWTWTNTINYSNKFGDHCVNALFGTEAIGYMYSNIEAWRDKYAFEDLQYMTLNAGEGTQTNAGTKQAWSLFSIFAKAEYNYADRYLVSATVRRDQSSRLYKDNNSGVFPAFTAAWRFTTEPFFPDQKWMTDGKIRVGWGQNGSAAISDYYAAYSTYAYDPGAPAYDINGTNTQAVAGLITAKTGNKDLKWETTTQTNIGLDLGFFNNSMTANLDWYLKTTKDMLTVPPVLLIAGQNAECWRNTGDMRNMGVELQLDYHSKDYSSFSFDLGFNLSHYKNTVVKLNDLVSYMGSEVRLIEGQPMGVYYGYVTDGIFQDATEVANHAQQSGKAVGRLRYVDINGDGIVDEKDQTIIGDPNPDLSFGLNMDFHYKGFTLSMFFTSELGFDIYNTTKRQLEFMSYGGGSTNRGAAILEAWSPTNTSTHIPAASVVDNNNEMRMSNYYVEDGSYFKMKYIKLGYDLPKKAVDAIHAQNINVYFQCENVFTATGYSGLDPELPLNTYGSRIDNGPYPHNRSFTMGLNLAF